MTVMAVILARNLDTVRLSVLAPCFAPILCIGQFVNRDFVEKAINSPLTIHSGAHFVTEKGKRTRSYAKLVDEENLHRCDRFGLVQRTKFCNRVSFTNESSEANSCHMP